MREAFEARIAADPRDFHTRKVFADWLEDNGNDADLDLAAMHRRWNEECQQAKERLEALAARLSNYYNRTPEEIAYDDDYGVIDMSYEKLLGVLKNVNDYEYKEGDNAYRYYERAFCLPYTTPEEVYTPDNARAIWRDYSLVTGQKTVNEERIAFTCSC